MGRRELLEALQREGRQTMAAISARGEDEEKRLRALTEERRAGLRRAHELQSERRCTELQRTIISGAKQAADLIRLRAEHSLALRLRERARISVLLLRADDPAALFHGLAAELPREAWRTVQVNPDSAALAKDCFPAARIIVDAALSAGLKVMSADNGLTVDNTLQTRLERLWPELLPELFAELRRKPL